MKNKIPVQPITEAGLDRWTARSEAETKLARSGKPKGKLNAICAMENDFSRIPNALFEDEAGQLWLAFAEHFKIQPEGGFEAVNVETALAWLQYVSEFVDGYDCDIADICRLALREIRSRPSDLERVKRAIEEDARAGFKLRGARKEGRQ
jgi:hypothetical protein